MEWNNGTVFRVFVNSGPVGSAASTIDCKVDIPQQELNNNCFIGVENFVIKPTIDGGDNTGGGDDPIVLGPKTIALQNFWASAKYLVLSAPQLPPYIDFTSQNLGDLEFDQQNSRNTFAFARLPLIAAPTLGNGQLTTEATFASDRVLNKDSILYDMRNNPMALSNGRLTIRFTTEDGSPLFAPNLNSAETEADPFVGSDPLINSLAFTLVIYKSAERYN